MALRSLGMITAVAAVSAGTKGRRLDTRDTQSRVCLAGNGKKTRPTLQVLVGWRGCPGFNRQKRSRRHTGGHEPASCRRNLVAFVQTPRTRTASMDNGLTWFARVLLVGPEACHVLC